MKYKNYHTVGTVLKSIRKIVDRSKIVIDFLNVHLSGEVQWRD